MVYDYDFEGNGVDKTKVKQFGVDESYKIEMNPVSYKVVKIERAKYKDKEHIYQSTSNDPYPHSPLTPSLAANIIEMKYNLGVPLYRYAKYMNTFGLNVSPQDLSNYVMRTLDILNPLYCELEKALVSTPYNVIHGDETTLEIIDSSKDKCYMFVYTTSFWDNAVYIYKFSESRKIDNTVDLLNNFNGYFECDGYVGYDALPNKVEGKIKIQRCWTHMRRYFTDCLKSISEAKRKKSPAYNVVNKINEMFKYEKMMREKCFTKKEIEEFRQGREYQKTIHEIDTLITNIDYGSDSYLKKAVEHYKNDKTELYTFVENGYVDINNNLAERTIKPFVVARKNFMFCKTADGAQTTGKLFSIIQTTRANGIKTELYLKYVIENIDKMDINNLLPWSENIVKQFKISTSGKK
ncbi:MAG: IS66 family transposase [Roseburia sp.]|nr:IS66 family transposase [Anaeroplasma bactoclasticum]MCM1196843.1 IS66 family transposase [Roseburia sp.]MCM1557041.1 IS66 family transposase [Anaeroplasma bactoclasticum]